MKSSTKILLEYKLPCIYVAQSATTRKCYVGQSTKGLHHRRKRHRKQQFIDNDKFHSAIRELGWDDFQWEVVFIVQEELDKVTLQELLNKKEQFYIKRYNSIEEGYNTQPGGQNLYCKYSSLEEKQIEKNRKRRIKHTLNKEKENKRKNAHRVKRKLSNPEEFFRARKERQKKRLEVQGISLTEANRLRRSKMTKEEREMHKKKQFDYKHSWSKERRELYNKQQKARKLARKLANPEEFKAKKIARKLARLKRKEEIKSKNNQ